MFFAVAAHTRLGGSVCFDLPSGFIERSNLGMRRGQKEASKPKGIVLLINKIGTNMTLVTLLRAKGRWSWLWPSTKTAWSWGLIYPRRVSPHGVMTHDRCYSGLALILTTVGSF